MGHHIARRNIVAGQNVQAERLHRLHLRVRKGVITPLMALVLDLDTDGAAVVVGDAVPRRFASLPGTVLFFDHLNNGSLQIDKVLAGNLYVGVAKPLQCGLGAHHSGVMQYKHANGRPAWALVVAGCGAPDMGQLGAH